MRSARFSTPGTLPADRVPSDNLPCIYKYCTLTCLSFPSPWPCTMPNVALASHFISPWMLSPKSRASDIRPIVWHAAL
eukprot:9716407-Karenia_brevis.AAC.1